MPAITWKELQPLQDLPLAPAKPSKYSTGKIADGVLFSVFGVGFLVFGGICAAAVTHPNFRQSIGFVKSDLSLYRTLGIAFGVSGFASVCLLYTVMTAKRKNYDAEKQDYDVVMAERSEIQEHLIKADDSAEQKSLKGAKAYTKILALSEKYFKNVLAGGTTAAPGRTVDISKMGIVINIREDSYKGFTSVQKQLLPYVQILIHQYNTSLTAAKLELASRGVTHLTA